MFSLVSLSKSKFFTHGTLASHSCRSCRTRVVRVALLSHSCRSCLTRVHSRRIRVALVLLVSGTRLVK